MLILFSDHPSSINRFVVPFTKCKSYFSTRTLKVKEAFKISFWLRDGSENIPLSKIISVKNPLSC